MKFLLYFDEPQQEPQEPQEPEKKYSDEDLDRIIGEKFVKWQKQQEKKIDEAKKMAQMTEAERTKAERDALAEELATLKKAHARAEMERQARALLSQEGIAIPDSLVAHLVQDDAEATTASIKDFAKQYKTALQDGIKSQLAHKQPGKTTSGGLTKADIFKEPDPIKRQHLIKSNMSLFK